MRRSSQRPTEKPTAKMSKAEADYQEIAPSSERCGTCQMFRMLDSCTAVEGRISSRGVCRIYESALDVFQGELDAKRERTKQASPFVASPANE